MRKASFLVLTWLLLAGFAFGGEAIANWSAPAAWSPAKSHGGLTTMNDVTGPLPFIGLTPCRIADTRGNGFTGAYGPPSLAGGVPRNFTLTGRCGIPAFVAAASLNVTVTNAQGPGFILIYPQGSPQPTVSTLNYVAGQTIANAAIVPLGGGAITVVAGVSGTDLLIDVNGYYSSFTDTSLPFILFNNPINVVTSVSAAVLGQNSETTLASVGIEGSTISPAFQTAAVLGIERGRPGGSLVYDPSGVRGESLVGNGVLGVSRFQGVAGSVVNTTSSELAYGILGFNNGTVYGVFAGGAYGSTGAKFFVEPHPTDASKVIRYVSLEGPEAGTYFRGRGKFQNGLATIDVPEDFRMVTDPEGLSVQVTPIGELATVAVLRIDLEGILVKASRNVEFFYTVNGVRKTHRDLKPIGPGSEFMPKSADARMPAYLTEGQKALLVSNGTYNADGTVNMETAERLGWAKTWREREE